MIYLPASLRYRDVVQRVCDQIRINAGDAGEFVEEILIVGCDRSQQWTKWTTYYLPGQPGPFPTVPAPSSRDDEPRPRRHHLHKPMNVQKHLIRSAPTESDDGPLLASAREVVEFS